MSDVVKNIIGLLKGDDGVAALVEDRIYRGIAPSQASLPRITINRISTPERAHSQGGASGLVQTRSQVDCWATRGSNGHMELADAVREAMDGRQHSDIGTDSLSIKSMELVDEFDDLELPGDGTQGALPRVIQEYLVWHAESVPDFT